MPRLNRASLALASCVTALRTTLEDIPGTPPASLKHRPERSFGVVSGGCLVVKDCFDLCCAELRERTVYFGSAGQDVAGVQVIFTAVEPADDAAGLADDQGPGSQVPGAEPGLPESVEAPGRDVTQVKRGSAGPAHPRRVADHLGQHVEIRRDFPVGLAKRKARANQRPFDLSLAADPDAPAVELRTDAARGGK